MGEVIGLFSVVLIFGMIPTIVIFIARSRHKERMELIAKGEYSAFSRLDIQSPPLPGRNALFWGLVAIGLGLAGIIFFIVMGIDDGDEFFLALASLVVGGAMLLYYRMLAPLREKASEAYDTQLALMKANGNRTAAVAKSTEEQQV